MLFKWENIKIKQFTLISGLSASGVFVCHMHKPLLPVLRTFLLESHWLWTIYRPAKSESDQLCLSVCLDGFSCESSSSP